MLLQVSIDDGEAMRWIDAACDQGRSEITEPKGRAEAGSHVFAADRCQEGLEVELDPRRLDLLDDSELALDPVAVLVAQRHPTGGIGGSRRRCDRRHIGSRRDGAAQRSVAAAADAHDRCHIDDLNLLPGSVDVVLFSGSIVHMHNREEIYRLIGQSLRPGGRLLVSDCFFPKQSRGDRGSDATHYIFVQALGYVWS
jgi:SAM-dependent methyltransferase